jgi:hypothetical protein
MIMEPTSSNAEEKVSASQAAPQPGKLVIRSVVSHATLINWIKERNPIIAQARKDERGR